MYSDKIRETYIDWFPYSDLDELDKKDLDYEITCSIELGFCKVENGSLVWLDK